MGSDWGAAAKSASEPLPCWGVRCILGAENAQDADRPPCCRSTCPCAKSMQFQWRLIQILDSLFSWAARVPSGCGGFLQPGVMWVDPILCRERQAENAKKGNFVTTRCVASVCACRYLMGHIGCSTLHHNMGFEQDTHLQLLRLRQEIIR